MKAIECDSLYLSYDGAIVVENLTFSTEEGDYLAVVGENGSGKSTLLRAVIGEISPVSGRLSIPKEIRQRGIGYLPQQTVVQRNFPASVREVVLSGCVSGDRIGFGWSRDSKRKVSEIMETLKIGDLASKNIGELSGGQRQKVFLARAVVSSPRLLLLDEPVTGLDPDAAHEMYGIIRMLNREKSMTVVMVTHDIQCALHEAGHVLSLCRGHYFYGTVDGYYEHEKKDAEDDHRMHGGTHCHHHGEETEGEGHHDIG